MSDEARAKRAAALESDEWTEGEKMILRWQYRELGGFWTHFFEALCRADDVNLDHLHRAFPSVVDAMRSWRYGDLGERLRDADLCD